MNTPHPAELPHSTKRHAVTGKISVHFACPACKADLHAPITDAGTSERCPECAGLFRVPGTETLREEDRRRTMDEEKRKASHEAERQRQLARAQVSAGERKLSAAKEYRARRVSPRTTSLSYLGVVLVALGLFVCGAGLMTETSIATTETTALGISLPSRVEDIGRLQSQAVQIIGGCLAMFTGILLLGLARVGEELHYWGRTIADRVATDPDVDSADS